MSSQHIIIQEPKAQMVILVKNVHPFAEFIKEGIAYYPIVVGLALYQKCYPGEERGVGIRLLNKRK